MPKKTASVTNGYKYNSMTVRGKDGKLIHSVGNNDAVCRAMFLHFAKGGTVKQVLSVNNLTLKTKTKDQGLIRMSAGTRLRAVVRNGGKVKIGAITVSSLRQKVMFPKTAA